MAVLASEYRRELEIRRYPLAVYVLVPLLALVLQAWLPRVPVVGRFTYFDLPLLITVYFALGRRNPVHGTLLGAALGIIQDGLTQGQIGIWGIANTVCGFLAASIGIRVVVENHTIRMALNFCFTLLASSIAFFVTRGLLGLNGDWNWLGELLKAGAMR